MAPADGKRVGGAEAVSSSGEEPPNGRRRRPLGREARAALGPRSSAALVAKSRWRPRAGASESAEARAPFLHRRGGGRLGGTRFFCSKGFRGPGLGRRGAGMTRRKEGAGLRVLAVRNGRLAMGFAWGVGFSSVRAPGTRCVWAGSQPWAWSRVARSPRSPWAAGSFVPAPRCPLFLPSAGRRGREEGGSGCPDVSVLSDCGAGQSRAGVCGRWGPRLAAFGVGADLAGRERRPETSFLFNEIMMHHYHRRNSCL
ncbi:uncharacterized protein LOC144580095 [Callithrix jacchus]